MAITKSDVKARFDSSFKSVTSSVYEKIDGETLTQTTELIGSLRGINQPTASDNIKVDYLRTGSFKIGFPKAVKKLSDEVEEVLAPIVAVLDSVTAILQAIQEIIPDRSDALSILLSSIFSQIYSLLDNLSSIDASVRVLPIPPIHPTSSKANKYTTADLLTAEAYAELISGAYSGSIQSNAFPGEDPDRLRRMLVGETGSAARYKDGSSGFLAAIQDSFEDKLDFNRPTETFGYTAGASVQLGAQVSTVIDAWDKLYSTFVSSKKKFSFLSSEGLGVPKVRILSAKSLGVVTSSSGGTEATIRIRLSNIFPVIGRDALRSEEYLYYPAKIAFSFVHNTSTSKFSGDRVSNIEALQTFSSPNLQDIEVGAYSGAKKPEFIGSFEEDGSSRGVYTCIKFSEEENSDDQLVYINSVENLNKIELDYTDLLNMYVDRDYLEVQVKIYSRLASGSLSNLLDSVVSGISSDAYVKATVWYKKFFYSAGDYVVRTANYGGLLSLAVDNLADGLLMVTSASQPIRFPADSNSSLLPVLPGGPPPNWIRYGKKYQIPVIKNSVDSIKQFAGSLEASISSTSNTLSLAIAAQLSILKKINTQIASLKSIVSSIDRLLSVTSSIGGNCMLFTSDGGSAGPLKALTDHYQAEKAKYEAAELSGASTDKIDWFANGESVCGVVILATSESAEKAKRLIDLIMLLIGSGEPSTNTSGQDVLPETPTLSGASSNFLPDLTVTSRELFSGNFSGLSSENHTESPENACE